MDVQREIQKCSSKNVCSVELCVVAHTWDPALKVLRRRISVSKPAWLTQQDPVSNRQTNSVGKKGSSFLFVFILCTCVAEVQIQGTHMLNALPLIYNPPNPTLQKLRQENRKFQAQTRLQRWTLYSKIKILNHFRCIIETANRSQRPFSRQKGLPHKLTPEFHPDNPCKQLDVAAPLDPRIPLARGET